MNWELGVESGIKASHRHSQFWGWHNVVPVVAYWMHLIRIQLGFLGLRLAQEIHKLDVSMQLLLLKNGQWDVCTGRRCSAKETVFGSLPNFCCPGKRYGFNRIGHPDWVKLCVQLNCAPNQNTFCYKGIEIYLSFSGHITNMMITHIHKHVCINDFLFISFWI